MSKLTKEDRTAVFTALKSFAAPLNELPLGKTFKIEINFKDDEEAVVDSDNLRNIVAVVTGDTFQTEASIYKVANLIVDTEKLIKKKGRASCTVKSTEVLFSRNLKYTAGTNTLAEYVKLHTADVVDLTFKVVAFVGVHNAYSTDNAPRYKLSCYSGYSAYASAMVDVNFNKPEDINRYRKLRTELYSTVLQDWVNDKSASEIEALVDVVPVIQIVSSK